MDEPAAALDPLARQEFLTAVAAESRERKITVLHSSDAVADLENESYAGREAPAG